MDTKKGRPSVSPPFSTHSFACSPLLFCSIPSLLFCQPDSYVSFTFVSLLILSPLIRLSMFSDTFYSLVC